MRVNRLAPQNQEYDMARRSKPTAVEQRKITRRLKKKYPQMYETRLTKREKKVISRASKADRKELERMVGKQLKKLYGGK